MKKLLKWIGIIAGVLVAALLITGFSLSVVGEAKLGTTMEVQPAPLSIPTDAASLERGEHLVKATCLSCHGEDLSGQLLMDDPAIGTIYAANITGLGDTHSDEELVLAIRHGLGQDGRQLMVMPSESFIKFSAEDLGAVIAYLKSVPAVEKDLPGPSLGIMGRIMLAAGLFGQVFPADYIDHSQPFVAMPEIGANEDYGRYLTGLCTSCHGADLKGGETPDPDAPPAPDLTQAGNLAGWSGDDFVHMMRTGVTPDGRAINPEYMPWRSIGKLYDDELMGLWMYLQTRPAE